MLAKVGQVSRYLLDASKEWMDFDDDKVTMCNYVRRHYGQFLIHASCYVAIESWFQLNQQPAPALAW